MVFCGLATATTAAWHIPAITPLICHPDRGLESERRDLRLCRPSFALLIGCRGPPHDSSDHNQALVKIEIVEYAVVADAPPPGRGLSLQTFDVALERILLHREERSPNARLIS